MARDQSIGQTDFACLLDHIAMAVDATIRSETAATAAAPPSEDIAVLHRLAETLPGLKYHRLVTPASHPAVDRWLDDAVARCPDSNRELARAFARCAPGLRWNRAYADGASTPGLEHYWRNYSFAVLASPEGGDYPPGPYRSDELAVFLVVQGASVVYERHHHPAVETYGIVRPPHQHGPRHHNNNRTNDQLGGVAGRPPHHASHG